MRSTRLRKSIYNTALFGDLKCEEFRRRKSKNFLFFIYSITSQDLNSLLTVLSIVSVIEEYEN